METQLSPVETSLIEPGSPPVYVVAHRTIGAAESGTTSTVFTATSKAVTTVSKSVATKLTVSSGAVVVPVPSPTATASPSPGPSASATPVPCTPGTATTVASGSSPPTATTQGNYTLSTLFLYHVAPVGDTAARASTTMGSDSTALEPRLCNWSTDLHANAGGRYLDSSTSTTAPAIAKKVEFHFQPGSAAQDAYRGDPVLTLYAQCPSGSPTITVELLSLSGAAYTTRKTVTMSTSGCTASTFTRFSAQLTGMPTFQLGSLSDKLVVRLTSSAPVRLAYGASPVPATLTIGMR